jgi:negative regulator of flagellin synthesis FlgM
MVDAVRSTTVTSADLRVAAVARTPRAAPTTTPVSTPATPTVPLTKQLAAAAPVDTDRVRLIKDAVARGAFPLSPATVADRLIAARYEWMQNDAS